MSAMSFARHAFRTEKPHSSITDWVEILTSPAIEEEAYDGIPELVDAINLQGNTGTAEASRALRKKLKHGNTHQQYRALVALAENCDRKFQTSFVDPQLRDAIMRMCANPDGAIDKRVVKKTMLILYAWQDQFKDDPSMATVAGLYQHCKQDKKRMHDIQELMGFDSPEVIAKRREKEAEKETRRQQRAAEKEKRAKERERKARPRFNFEQEKPKVLSSIAEASQASSNLINAITLVNREKESLESNERVQDCLGKAKLVRKQIIRYIQLVENEEVIGTLIETNDRIMGALEMYDQLSAADTDPSSLASGMAAVTLAPDSEVGKLQQKQRAAIERHASQQRLSAHPDLEDLNFDTSALPAPIKPSNVSPRSPIDDEIAARGSLSDYSDYTSDEEDHNNGNNGESSTKRDYGGLVDVGDEDGEALANSNNPFADPFADEVAVGPSKK